MCRSYIAEKQGSLVSFSKGLCSKQNSAGPFLFLNSYTSNFFPVLPRRELKKQFPIRSGSYLIEDVKASFSWVSCDHARFFQQEVGDFPAIWFTAGAELNLKVLALPEETCGVEQHLNTHILTHTHTNTCGPLSCVLGPKEKGGDEIPSST